MLYSVEYSISSFRLIRYYTKLSRVLREIENERIFETSTYIRVSKYKINNNDPFYMLADSGFPLIKT